MWKLQVDCYGWRRVQLLEQVWAASYPRTVSALLTHSTSIATATCKPSLTIRCSKEDVCLKPSAILQVASTFSGKESNTGSSSRQQLVQCRRPCYVDLHLYDIIPFTAMQSQMLARCVLPFTAVLSAWWLFRQANKPKRIIQEIGRAHV